jgi:hypothetical protein
MLLLQAFLKDISAYESGNAARNRMAFVLSIYAGVRVGEKDLRHPIECERCGYAHHSKIDGPQTHLDHSLVL